jgi:hypothetical protein
VGPAPERSRGEDVRRASRLLSALLLAGACLPASALAAPSVRLHASFSPEIPGHSTTVGFRVQIAPGRSELVPPPLVEANIRYPARLDIALSGLGIETCSAATLERSGPQGCSVDSLMGAGHAIAEFPVKGAVVREAARLAVVRTTEQEGHLAMLLYAYDERAVSARIIFAGQLLPAPAPFGGRLEISVPLVQSLPEAPDLAVSEIQLAIGAKGLTYYERVRGKVVAYKPAGIELPRHCPRGGFPFSVELGFLGGMRVGGRTAVACPG